MRTVLIFLLFLVATAHAGTPTDVVVRVLAHDAKLLGDVAGGAAVEIVDATTGALLAHGLQTGDTGSTDAIVREPWIRGDDRFDTEGAAAFRATLDLDRPTRVTIRARGPLGHPTSQFSAARTLVVVPGEDLDGNGVVLTLQGLIVNMLQPHAEASLEAGSTLRVEAGVKLLCTCPIEADGLWDAADYDVRAELWRGERMVASAPLSFASTNVFVGALDLPSLGEDDPTPHELRIVAGNPRTGNWGDTHLVFRLMR